jgi:tRNA-uridine 2-sulfurtransferase
MSSIQTVWVGLSGGVDSAVAAALLQEVGFRVIGAFLEVWQPPGFPCSQEQDRHDAMRVAAHLKIPFELVDARDAYRERVAQYMIDGYRVGETPNPDVMCNREIKFGILYDRARAAGADLIATGHYARRDEREGAAALCVSADAAKDQTYFLWTLSQEKLAHTLFPLGNIEKTRTREHARAFGLPTAEKKDSQGICFLGKLDVREFLSQYIDAKSGAVLDTIGREIGRHEGAAFFTIGQRHGFSIDVQSPEQSPLYVISKDVVANTITVARDPLLEAARNALTLRETNWIRELPIAGETYQARARYRQVLFPVVVEALSDGGARLRAPHPHLFPAGQSLVLYRDDECIGGGVIADVVV